MLEVQLDAYQICYSCSFHVTSSNQLGSYLHMFCVNSITKVVWRWPEEICSVDVGYPTLNVLLTWNRAMREVPMVVRYSTFFNPILYLLRFMAFIKNSWHQTFSPWWSHTKTFDDLSLCNQENFFSLFFLLSIVTHAPKWDQTHYLTLSPRVESRPQPIGIRPETDLGRFFFFG